MFLSYRFSPLSLAFLSFLEVSWLCFLDLGDILALLASPASETPAVRPLRRETKVGRRDEARSLRSEIAGAPVGICGDNRTQVFGEPIRPVATEAIGISHFYVIYQWINTGQKNPAAA
jgi:hypothetical protein